MIDPVPVPLPQPIILGPESLRLVAPLEAQLMYLIVAIAQVFVHYNIQFKHRPIVSFYSTKGSGVLNSDLW